MDPQIKSLLTTIGMTLSTSVAAWAVTKGLVTADQQSALASILVSVAGAGVTAGLGWYKARQHTQTRMIQEVNKADNGVKVVEATVPAPAVDAPVKEGK